MQLATGTWCAYWCCWFTRLLRTGVVATEQVTWTQYYAACRQAGRAFVKLGLKPGHAVCILGFNSFEWFVADLGAIMAGGLAAGIYTTNNAEVCGDQCFAYRRP